MYNLRNPDLDSSMIFGKVDIYNCPFFIFLRILFQRKNGIFNLLHYALKRVLFGIICMHNFFYFYLRFILVILICSKFRNKMEGFESPKITEITKKYFCEKCNYKTNRHSEYNRHLLTAKHNAEQQMEQMEQQKSPKITKRFICDCGKTYKVSSGLYKHKKKCSLILNSTVIVENPEEKPTMMDIITQNKEIMDLLVLQNKELQRQNKEQADIIQRQHKEQADTIRELIPKIGNNNTTNNTNNQFNLQVFLNEDCKDALNFSDFIKQIQVSFEDIENQAECGYVKGISKLFIENLKELGTNKRPIHCTDKKRKTLYIKENDEWDKEGSQDILLKGIQEVTRRTMKTLIDEKVIQAEEFADMESDFSKKCLVIQRNLIPTAPREKAFGKVMENITKNSGIIE